LEQAKLSQEATQLAADVASLQQLLGSREDVLAMVVAEAQAVADRHGGPRRSLLVEVCARPLPSPLSRRLAHTLLPRLCPIAALLGTS
jgi:DNA gyrase/topoisomerase IV subunit A